MKEIHFLDIVDMVKIMCMDVNYNLGDDVLSAIDRAIEREESELGIEVLNKLKENSEVAVRKKIPLCQDTGIPVFFIEIGQDMKIKGGLIYDAINEGVRQGYKEGFLRNSIVADPIGRRNTKTYTPAIIHTELIPGDKLKLNLEISGGGCENMSNIKMLIPADGVEGVKNFVLETVKKIGANPCPPIVVGVGIGGDFELAAILAKKALLRSVGNPNPKLEIAALEEEIYKKINKLGIGPLGFGGRITALAVHIETYPCHIASLPVAVNICCHSARHKTIIM
ncbi:MAG: fumarate hydratase [Nitrospirota bacterium]